MNQSNLSLPFSKNASFSENNQSSQFSTDSQSSPHSDYDRYNVEIFTVGTVHQILSTPFASLMQAKQCAEQLKPEFQDLVVYPYTHFFTSEFSPGRQELLCRVVGVTRGLFVVAQEGRPVSSNFPSREQADAWRQLNLSQYPDCQILEIEAASSLASEA